jgi:undecaprenyl-diphosphatase
MFMAIDKAVFDFFAAAPHGGPADSLLAFITHAGDKGYIWLGMAAGLAVMPETRRYALGLFLSLVVVTIIGEGVLKPLIARPRPFILFGTEPYIVRPSGHSFPSGHTSSSFAAAFYLSYIQSSPLIRTGLFALASLMALSRLYLGVHYFSDIIGGVALGFLGAALVIMFQRRQRLL